MGPKKVLKNESKNDPPNDGQKYGPKHVQGEGARDRILVRRGLTKRAFESRIAKTFKNESRAAGNIDIHGV
jgi:hypothetical protein